MTRIAYSVKRSGWQAFVKDGAEARVKRLQKQKDPTAMRLFAAHEAHQRALQELLSAFESLGAKAVRVGPKHTDLTRDRYDLVVSLGGDGTLLRVSHRVFDVPVLGINSDPNTSVGFFCGARAGNTLESLERALGGQLPHRKLTRMRVTVAGKLISDRVLNDALFCHQSPAATSRYLIELGDRSEDQKSSGFWVGPAAGSTAAQRSAGGRVLPLASDRLQLVVRELYAPGGERYHVRKLLIEPGQQLVVRCKMRQAALFLDGPDDLVRPEFGDVLTFSRSEEPLTILGLGKKR